MPEEHSNEARFIRFYTGVMNDKDYRLIDELVAPHVVSHDPFPGQAPGPQGLKQTIAMFHEAFPDLHVEARVVVAGDDLVAAQFQVSGTHQGAFMGQPATGNAIAYAEAVTVRFRDGMIIEHWAVADVAGLMEAISPPR